MNAKKSKFTEILNIILQIKTIIIIYPQMHININNQWGKYLVNTYEILENMPNLDLARIFNNILES